MRQRWTTFFAAAVLVTALLGPFVSVLASASLRDFLYREMSYIMIADRVVGDERDPESVARRLNDFVAENVYPAGGPVLDTNSWNDLLRGIGWCDQDVWLLGTLLATRDIHGRLVFVSGEGGAHTVAEVFIDDDWRVFDPYYGLVFSSGSSLATYRDLARAPALTISYPTVQALPPTSRATHERFISTLYANTAEPTRWGSLLIGKYGSTSRWAVRQALRAYLRIFGTWGAHRAQDLYLALLPDELVAFDETVLNWSRPNFSSEADAPALFLYHRARNYHLYGRADQAEGLYRQILAEHSSSYFAEHSRYFLGVLYFRLNEQPDEAAAQLEIFIREYPDSAWIRLAHDTFGMIYEELGDFRRAAEHYQTAAHDATLKAAARLQALP
jgi:hypothetical protein